MERHNSSKLITEMELGYIFNFASLIVAIQILIFLGTELILHKLNSYIIIFL